MQIRIIDALLEGFGAPPSAATISVQALSLRDRLRRAGLAAGAGLVLAIILVPIPIVHFMAVPAALAGGFGWGAVRLTKHEIVEWAQGACPLCGHEQFFSLMGRFRLPRTVYCARCGKDLTLRSSASKFGPPE